MTAPTTRTSQARTFTRCLRSGGHACAWSSGSARDDTAVTGLQAQNQTFAQKISQQKTLITELRSTIEELQRQRRLHLGAQLMAAAVDPDTHAQLQLDHDRLAADNAALQHRLDEKDRLIAASMRTSPHRGRPTPTTSLA